MPPPDFRLRDQNGFWNQPKDARGDVLVISFLFSRCRDLCPRQAGEIKDAVLGAGGGVRVFAITVDPEHDTPKLARAWLRRWAWRAARCGSCSGPARSSRRCGATSASCRSLKEEEGYEWVPPPPIPERSRPTRRWSPTRTPTTCATAGRPRHGGGLDYEHSAYVLLVDKRGRQRVGFPYEQLTAELLLHDLRRLKAEA